MGVMAILYLEGPGGTAGSVARRAVRDQHHFAELDFVPIVKGTIDFDGVEQQAISAIEGAAPVVFEGKYLRVHRLHPGTRIALERCETANVIRVGMTDEQNFDVAQLKAERADVALDLRGGLGKPRIDEHEPR